jgi:sialidase-1
MLAFCSGVSVRRGFSFWDSLDGPTPYLSRFSLPFPLEGKQHLPVMPQPLAIILSFFCFTQVLRAKESAENATSTSKSAPIRYTEAVALRTESGSALDPSEHLEKGTLFEARTDGYHVFRIPGLVTTRRGTVLMHCDGRRAPEGQSQVSVLSNQDWARIDILMRRSLDHGKTWEPARVVVDHRDFEKLGVVHARGHSTVNNFTILAERERDRVHVLFCVNYKRCYHMYSDDDGLTFSTPTDITAAFEAQRPQYDWNVIAVGPGHGIQLRGGRLLFGTWLSTGGEKHRPSIVASLYSDDLGVTWQPGNVIVRSEGSVTNPNEPVPVELSDGRVLFNVRSESPARKRLVSISPDGAMDWSEPRFDPNLEEPVCFGSILKLPDAEGLVFCSPVPKPKSGEKLFYGSLREREQLTLRSSTDNGQSWAHSRVLEAGWAGYSDLTMTQDGHLLCAYERDRVGGDVGDDRFISVARFKPAWIHGKAP